MMLMYMAGAMKVCECDVQVSAAMYWWTRKLPVLALTMSGITLRDKTPTRVQCLLISLNLLKRSVTYLLVFFIVGNEPVISCSAQSNVSILTLMPSPLNVTSARWNFLVLSAEVHAHVEALTVYMGLNYNIYYMISMLKYFRRSQAVTHVVKVLISETV